MSSVPEHHGIKKTFGVLVGELQRPVPARVGGVVDAGLVAGAGRHEERFFGGEGDNRAEVETFSAGNLLGDPNAAVGGAKVSAVGARSPCNFFRDGAYAAQVFRGPRKTELRSALGKGSNGDEE